MTETLYIKVGKRYKPVGEFSYEAREREPYGTHLRIVERGHVSTLYNIDPKNAELLAALKIYGDILINLWMKQTQVVTDADRQPLSQRAQDLWNELQEEMHPNNFAIYKQSYQDIITNSLNEFQEYVLKDYDAPAVKKALENYILVRLLTKENKIDI